jgi:hypothetical protein
VNVAFPEFKPPIRVWPVFSDHAFDDEGAEERLSLRERPQNVTLTLQLSLCHRINNHAATTGWTSSSPDGDPTRVVSRAGGSRSNAATVSSPDARYRPVSARQRSISLKAPN